MSNLSPMRKISPYMKNEYVSSIQIRKCIVGGGFTTKGTKITIRRMWLGDTATVPDNLFSLAGIWEFAKSVTGLDKVIDRIKAMLPKREDILFGKETPQEQKKAEEEAEKDEGLTMAKQVAEGGVDVLKELIGNNFDAGEMVQNLIQTLIAEGAKKLVQSVATTILSMVTPASGLAKALKMAYDFIQWLRTNASKIISMVNKVVAVMSEIANGNTQIVADAVESGIVDSAVFLIDFIITVVADIDIGGIVQGAVTKLQTSVHNATDPVLTKIENSPFMKSLQAGGVAGMLGVTRPDEAAEPAKGSDAPAMMDVTDVSSEDVEGTRKNVTNMIDRDVVETPTASHLGVADDTQSESVDCSIGTVADNCPEINNTSLSSEAQNTSAFVNHTLRRRNVKAVAVRGKGVVFSSLKNAKIVKLVAHEMIHRLQQKATLRAKKRELNRVELENEANQRAGAVLQGERVDEFSVHPTQFDELCYDHHEKIASQDPALTDRPMFYPEIMSKKESDLLSIELGQCWWILTQYAQSNFRKIPSNEERLILLKNADKIWNKLSNRKVRVPADSDKKRSLSPVEAKEYLSVLEYLSRVDGFGDLSLARLNRSPSEKALDYRLQTSAMVAISAIIGAESKEIDEDFVVKTTAWQGRHGLLQTGCLDEATLVAMTPELLDKVKGGIEETKTFYQKGVKEPNKPPLAQFLYAHIRAEYLKIGAPHEPVKSILRALNLGASEAFSNLACLEDYHGQPLDVTPKFLEKALRWQMKQKLGIPVDAKLGTSSLQLMGIFTATTAYAVYNVNNLEANEVDERFLQYTKFPHPKGAAATQKEKKDREAGIAVAKSTSGNGVYKRLSDVTGDDNIAFGVLHLTDEKKFYAFFDYVEKNWNADDVNIRNHFADEDENPLAKFFGVETAAGFEALMQRVPQFKCDPNDPTNQSKECEKALQYANFLKVRANFAATDNVFISEMFFRPDPLGNPDMSLLDRYFKFAADPFVQYLLAEHSYTIRTPNNTSFSGQLLSLVANSNNKSFPDVVKAVRGLEQAMDSKTAQINLCVAYAMRDRDSSHAQHNDYKAIVEQAVNDAFANGMRLPGGTAKSAWNTAEKTVKVAKGDKPFAPGIGPGDYTGRVLTLIGSSK